MFPRKELLSCPGSRSKATWTEVTPPVTTVQTVTAVYLATSDLIEHLPGRREWPLVELGPAGRHTPQFHVVPDRVTTARSEKKRNLILRTSSGARVVNKLLISRPES